MARLSDIDRARIIAYHEQNKSTAWIVRKLGINRKTVHKWVCRHRLTGTVEPFRSKGRPIVLNDAARKRALELLLSASCGGARFVARQLFAEKYTDRLVSTNSVIRGAKQHAQASGDSITCLRGRPKKGLTQQNRKARVKFAEANKRTAWRRVLFTDRCKFYFRFPGTRVQPTRWVLRSKRHEAGVFKPNKPQAYNVYGGISYYGTTQLVPVTGTSSMKTKYTNAKGEASRNITKAEYGDVALKLFCGGGQIFSGRAGGPWVFQQDGDPTHGAAKHAKKTYHACGGGSRVSILPNWPGNSPDLSPIENVWAYVDREVAKKGCKTFEEFKREVDQTFTGIPKGQLKGLIASMPKRLQQVIVRDGEKASY